MDVHERIRCSRDHIDLTKREHLDRVTDLADVLLDAGAGAINASRDRDMPLEARLAGLVAESRQWLLSRSGQNLKVGVVFAMWGEHNRLLPCSPENPNGEDALATKLDQLSYAMDGTSFDWHLYAVDDGCPHGSGKIAQDIAAGHPRGDQVSVHFLADALPDPDGPLGNLASPADSRKAGAVILGCMKALEDGCDAVMYTDSDNSVHLGQIGLLLRPFVESGAKVVLGDRKHPDSVLVKEAARWGIGIKVLRHMQRMIGDAVFSRGILDTQAAFKLYESGLLAEIIEEPTVYDFSFDTDWILGAISRGITPVQVPFAFIDSAAESASIAQGPMTTWETLLFGLAKSIRRYGYGGGVAGEMIAVLEEEIRDYRDLEVVIDLLPDALQSAGETDFGDPGVMSPGDMRAWLREVLQR